MVALISVAAFRLGSSRHAKKANLLGGLFFACYGVGLWSLKLSDGFDWEWDLPLALCDIAFLLCLACFVKPRPLWVTLVTYWGLGGTLQALITPDITQAFPSREFLLFFVGHSVIVWAVFFLLGKAPHSQLVGWKGARTAFLWLLIYTLGAAIIDFSFSLNYGYLRAKPLGSSVLDYFGEWPLYILGALALALLIFLVLSLLLKMLPLQPERSTCAENPSG